MSLVTHSFDLDITPGAIPRIVNVSEYDENREYTVTLRKDGVTWAAPSGTTATIEGTLAGHPFSVEATVSGNTVTFSLDESMTAYAGDAWTKIKLTKDGKPVQTCAFILRNDRAGAEADAILHAPGFQEQINEGVAAYFDNDPPFFELPSGGQSGQALLSDGEGGAKWGEAQGGGSGLTDDVKQALLDCFENVAWINKQGQSYYNALYAALYPPSNLVSISATFNQGSAVIYDTDPLNTLKQYLTVTAHYDDSTTGVVTNYTLSGTMAAGTSTITVLYNGKSTNFTVTVTEHNPLPSGYTKVNYLENTSTSAIQLPVKLGSSVKNTIKAKVYADTNPSSGAGYGHTICGCGQAFSSSSWGTKYQLYLYHSSSVAGRISEAMFPDGTNNRIDLNGDYYGTIVELESVIQTTTPKRTLSSGSDSVTTDYTTGDAFNYDLCLFTNIIAGYQDTRSAFIGRIYSFSLEKDDSEVLNLVPCYRDSDNKPGMYDLISNTFLTNSGGGEFTWG